MLYQIAEWNKYDTTSSTAAAIDLKVAGRPDIAVKPALQFGMGTLRWTLWEVISSRQPGIVDRIKQRSEALRQGYTTNSLLRVTLGGDLFDMENPGRVNKETLKVFLDRIYMPPKSQLLGTSTTELYKLYRQPIEEYARVYRAMRKVGKRRVVRAYRKALKQHADPSQHYNEAMLGFYRTFTKSNNIAKRSGLMHRWDLSIMSGFWMRRMADGTDRMLWDFTLKVLKDYDPALYKELK